MAPPKKQSEGFSTLEVFRPVKDLGRFLGLVHHYGNEIFGNDGGSSLSTAYQVVGEKSETRNLVEDTGAPRLKVNDDPRLTLLYLQAPMRLRVHSNLNWLVNELDPHKRRKSGLRNNLEQAGLQYDIPRQEGLQICCDDLEVLPNHLLDTKDLVLTLTKESAVTDMLKDQAGICVRALLNRSTKASSPYVATPNIPIARFPADSSWEDRSWLRSELLPYVSSIGRLSLGDFDCKVAIYNEQ